MDIKDALGFLFQRADATQTFWNLYLGVVTTILGLLTAAKVDWFRREVCIALTFVFALFAYSNFASLDAVRQQRASLVQAAVRARGFQEDIYRPVLDSVGPPGGAALKVFHFVFDLFVVAAVWLVPFLRRKRVLAATRR
jgi:hypothetical protein